ncbi:hypothetical protein MF271_11890 [Deinococcus sp. KNUC1210]|uniref:hypothetical protein n=1 Tax=Deinococcus sp. KNUC1210 TaxID=2917691 RepID=UPI001EEFA52B|nr:hypothetical protein [Deinococcus sp. KNUC1210]ULH14702.1 hypothetical protein MF271_11890 [Deinococcus sp. KNUC1210]
MDKLSTALEPYRRPGPARFRLYGGLYALLILTALLGNKRSGDIGTLAALRRSSFTRIMFMDIGALSTLGALYLALTGRTPARFPAAIASLFVGSFALIPGLAYEDWAASHSEAKVPPVARSR